MKLLQRTYLLTSVWLIPVTIVGSLFCFRMIEYVAYEETDEFLTYEMERILKHHREHGQLPAFHQAAAILPDVHYPNPFFRDTLILEPGDQEMVPHRELRFSLEHRGQSFGIVLRHLLLGHDDIAFGTLLIIVGLVLLTAVFLFVLVNVVARRIWRPFYRTLNQLSSYRIEESPPVFPETSIDEFNRLQSTLSGLLQKLSDDYQRIRQFNANASHELQTPLAVIRARTEKLLNMDHPDDHVMHEVHRIHESATRLAQAQKSLMLLSRIGNREFDQNVELDLSTVITGSLEMFEEVAQLRNITTSMQLAPCPVKMDPGLAQILIQNLIKNAIKHNIPDGKVHITTDAGKLEIENTGLPYDGDPQELLARFATGPEGGSGIGLAIVREICDIYGFTLTYKIRPQTIHVIAICFN